MIIVPDANSLISALIKRGKALDLFEWNDFNREIKFIAPETLSLEVKRNLQLITKKSGLTKSEILELLSR